MIEWENLILKETEIPFMEQEISIEKMKDLQVRLNQLGKDGWELVTILSGTPNIYFFKRAITPKSAERISPSKEKSPGGCLEENDLLFPSNVPLNDHFGSTLIDAEVITKEQWEQAREMQKEKNLPIDQVLVELGFISEDEATQLLELYFGAPYIKLSEYILERKALNLIPKTECFRDHLLPVSLEENVLTIAMANPRDFLAVDNARVFSEKEIRVVYSSLDEIDRAIEMYYEDSPSTKNPLEASKEGEK